MATNTAPGPRRARRAARPILNRGGAAKGQGYKITNATTAGGTAVVDIHGEIGGFYGGINAAEFIAELRAVNASEMEVNLTSPGGDVFEGIDIYQAILDWPGTVTVRINALAGSIASVIAQAGDRVVMGSAAKMMIHAASGGAWGKAEELRFMAERLDDATNTIAQLYAARTNTGTARSWRAAMDAGVDGTWYSASEAVEAGLADEVNKAAGRGGDAEPEAMWRASMFAQLEAWTAERAQASSDGERPLVASGDLEPPTPPSSTTAPDDGGEIDPDHNNVGGETVDQVEGVNGEAEPGPDLIEAIGAIDLSGLGDAVTEAITNPGPQINLDPTVLESAITDTANNAHPIDPPTPTPPPEPTPTEALETVGRAIMEGIQQL